ncbi:TetR/AcrR family transcriptional regulator [Kineococcus radiotolerans]|uniref:Transcriptional regulator, TetR family n=1 Tax=Kineococcus radiotolerans (strain ATCC BAA-149 / DSM 14245 / SRS30216) TaxID=266940 RepID=A6W4M5_KINRD|nr:TetR/AcrR family transcriptional regulator [Kineococcus radiotolerans]ABS01764.1 transcriptional regulator, TetR family [Kineococcus radiotolerans SRS30216 = ATCC BAA-149]
MTTAQPSLRERRRTETTALIAQAALDLALESGWDAVTVDEIAARAGLSRRTFFNYFATKDEALLHNAVPWDEDLLDAFRASTGPLLGALEELFTAQSASGRHDRDRTLQVMRLVEATPELLPALLARIAASESVLAEAIVARDGLDEFSAAACAAVAGSLARVGGMGWLSGRQPDPVTSTRAAWTALRALLP